MRISDWSSDVCSSDLVEGDKISITFNKPELVISLPEEAFLIDGLQVIKKAISGDLFKFIPTVESIKFLEIYNKSKPASKAKRSEERRVGKACVRTCRSRWLRYH